MTRETVRIEGHFGEWMQGCLGPQGPLALLTVACPALAMHAERTSFGPLALDQAQPVLTESQAERLLDGFGAPTGRFRLRAEMPAGGGAGASTASLIALAHAALDRPPGAEALAKHCLAIEGATDPLMLPAPDTVLWAPRAARALRPLPAPLPAEIVGGFWGPAERTDPDDLSFPDIADLVARWLDAATLDAQAQIAAASAERCTALRGPADDPFPGLARSLSALGHLRAHTGSARGLIFAPGTVPKDAMRQLERAGATRVLTFRTGHAR